MNGAELNLYRKNLLLTVGQLAEILEITNERTIRRWESGEVPVPKDVSDRVQAYETRARAMAGGLVIALKSRVENWEAFHHGVPLSPWTCFRFSDAYTYAVTQGLEYGLDPHAHILHTSALSRVQSEVPDLVRIVDFDSGAYQGFLEREGLPPGSESCREWAASLSNSGAPSMEGKPEKFMPPEPEKRIIGFNTEDAEQDLKELAEKVGRTGPAVIELLVCPAHIGFDAIGKTRNAAKDFANALVDEQAFAGYLICTEKRGPVIALSDEWADAPVNEVFTDITDIDHEEDEWQELPKICDAFMAVSMFGGHGALLWAIVYRPDAEGIVENPAEVISYELHVVVGFESPDPMTAATRGHLTGRLVITPLHSDKVPKKASRRTKP